MLDRGGPRPIPVRTKLVLLGTYIVAAATVITMIYVSGQPVGDRRAEGVQARHLLPLVLLLVQVLCGHNLFAGARNWHRILPAITISAVLGIAGTWYAMITHYSTGRSSVVIRNWINS